MLRFDERGVGASAGDNLTATSYDLARDAEMAVAYLREQPQIERSQVGLLGHSEGAWLAAMLAARDSDIAFVIALAGHAVPGAELLPVQAERGLRSAGVPEEEIDAILADQIREIELIVAQDWEALEERIFGQTVAMIEAMPEAQREALGDIEAAARAQVDRSMMALRGWLYTFLSNDPVEDWRQVKAPVLAVFGALDTQVDVVQNRPPLVGALEAAGNTDVTVIVLDNANHLFQEAESAGDDYASLSPQLTPDLLPIVGDWITGRKLFEVKRACAYQGGGSRAEFAF